MRNFVIINGVNSNTINGLGINELPPITKPEMRNIREEIDGRDGDIITNLGYSAYDKTITIGLFGTGYDINNIVAFFNGEGTIVFSNEQDKYYNFKILNQIDYESLQKFKTASITFHCQPFKYPLTETPLEIEYDYIEDEGETLTLNNTGNALMELDLKGNTSQSGTPTPTSPIPVSVVSGDNDVVVSTENKLPYYQSATYTNNGIDYTSVGDGTYKLNNTATNTSYWEMTLDEAYTIQASDYIQLNNDKAISNVQFVLRDTTNTQIGAFGCTSVNKIYSLSSYAGRTIGRIRCYVVNGTAINNLTLRPMICNSSTQIDFVIHQSQTYEVDLYNSVNIFDGVLELGGYENNGVKDTRTDRYRSANKIQVRPNTQYTFSINGVLQNYVVVAYQRNGTFISIGDTSSGTYTTPSNCYYIAFRCYIADFTNDYATLKVQIQKGTTSTAFEDYTPIELCKIGTYQDYFTKNSGKNLFNKDSQDILENVRIGADGWNNADSGYFISEFIEVTPNTTYTKNTIADAFHRFAFYTDKSTSSFISKSEDNTITTPSNAKYLRICGLITEKNSIMLNEGSTILPYEPYGTGQWCKYNAIGKVVLDGTQSVAREQISNSYYKFYINNISNVDYGDANYTPKIMSDKLIAVGRTQMYLNTQGISSANNNLQIYTDATKNMTVDEFRPWLSNNKITVYYGLITPYLSLIEDNNLIEQLNELENAMSYEGTTNIGQVNNDKAFIISAKALEKGTNEVVINNIGNVYSKPLLALEGSGNVDIYLDNTQILKANVEDKMNIDIAQLEAYNPDTMTLLNRQVIGNYNSMTLQPGNNTIRIDGALDKATITNYTRWL